MADAPSPLRNVLLPSHEKRLAQASVANVSRIVARDERQLSERVRKIPRRRFELIRAGSETILWREAADAC